MPIFEAILLPIYRLIRRSSSLGRISCYIDNGSGAAPPSLFRDQAEILASSLTEGRWAINWGEILTLGEAYPTNGWHFNKFRGEHSLHPSQTTASIFFTGSTTHQIPPWGFSDFSSGCSFIYGKTMSCWVVAGAAS